MGKCYCWACKCCSSPFDSRSRNLTICYSIQHERKEKLGDRIVVLQQLVSPYGKTDTASVLLEAVQYIRFLHEQFKVSPSNGAPSALVSLIGHRQYRRCASDFYYFLQSSICMKQPAYGILELLSSVLILKCFVGLPREGKNNNNAACIGDMGIIGAQKHDYCFLWILPGMGLSLSGAVFLLQLLS
ncbi:hypothetical protein Nepgr_001933 [Nepenthes gracilis]|uniref:BHLH domain-containing protein n=1 Tax=Nepenthes gracilis TaxID=150966 RepID=A0AAD3RXF8_NEPGR|nr:hypothetical protein Nepgr_001933 [Nepenthes gracilis]